jgi:hypothetical protein
MRAHKTTPKAAIIVGPVTRALIIIAVLTSSPTTAM